MGRRFVVISAVALLLAVPAKGQDGNRLVILGGQDRTVTLIDAEGRNGKVGSLTLLVRNDSDRRVRFGVRFYPAGSGLPILLEPPPDEAFSAKRPTLYTARIGLATGQLSVPPRHTTLMPLSFGVGKDAQAGVLDGLLVVRAQGNADVQQASVSIIGKALPTTEEKTPAVQPPKVTLRVQRLFPFGIREGWRLVVEPIVWVPGEKSDALVLLSSDSGHSMKAQLTGSARNEPMPAGMIEQHLVVRDLDTVGAYAGKLTLRTGGTETVDVEANVRDVIFWPLLVAGLAAALGGFLVIRGQRWRTRRLLQSELIRAQNAYENTASDSPIGSPGGPTSPAAIAQLLADIAAATSEEDLDELSKTVGQVRDAIGIWSTIDRSARRVVKLREEGYAHGENVVEHDIETVLKAASWIPDDTDDAAEIDTQLRRQEAILHAFDRAHRLWTKLAVDAYAQNPEAWKDDAKTSQLIGSLNRIEEPAVLYVRAVEGDIGVDIAGLSEPDKMDLALSYISGPMGRRGGDVSPPLSATVRLTPEQLLRPVRRWDWVTGIVTFLATVLVFVFGVYDDTFGTWDDYAKVIALGLLGQIGGAALWNLFPSLRSYRLPLKPAT